MQALASGRFDLPPDTGKWPALTLSLLMHLLLVAALLFAVRWQTKHVPLQAELWSAIPREAVNAPPPPAPAPVQKQAPEPPPPPPVKARPTPPAPAPTPPKSSTPAPDIAIAKEKPKPVAKVPEKSVEKQVAKPAPKPAPKPVPAKPKAPDFSDQLAAADREATRRRESLERTAIAEREARDIKEAREAAEAAARSLAEADYAALIRNKIRGNIVLPPRVQGNPEAIFDVIQLPNGEVLSVKLYRSSGMATLDAAIERAIMKSSPLPLPKQSELFRRELRLKYRPFES